MQIKMGPKRTLKKRGTRGIGNTMRLRSGTVRKHVVQEAVSSRNVTQHTPKRRRPSRRCPFVDDEAIEEDASESDHEVEEDSNVLGGTPLTSLPLIATTSSSQTTRRLAFMERGVDDSDTPDHHKHFGEKISIGLMNDVLAQFNVTHDTEPPLVPLCRLVPTDAVWFAVDDVAWLVPLFDRAAYMPTMGFFIVSVKGRHGEFRPLTRERVEQWDPIWQRMNEEFESKLSKEWDDLKGKLFYVWDGNHRLKTWMKRIEDGKVHFSYLFYVLLQEI